MSLKKKFELDFIQNFRLEICALQHDNVSIKISENLPHFFSPGSVIRYYNLRLHT